MHALCSLAVGLPLQAQGFDKRQLYEADIRIPYIVRGPGVPKNRVLLEPFSHVDLAPTIIDIATGCARSGAQCYATARSFATCRRSVPANWDGRSAKALLQEETHEEAAANWVPRVLIQYYGESGRVEECGNGIGPHAYAPGPNGKHDPLAPNAFSPAPCDQWYARRSGHARVGTVLMAHLLGVRRNNTYACTRRVAVHDGDAEDIYCETRCFADRSMDPVPCDGVDVEYYDLKTDPWQLENKASSLAPSVLKQLKADLDAMRACKGQSQCQPGK